MISGFGTPVTVGPALENQHGSPLVTSRGNADGTGSPPDGSRAGASKPICAPSTLRQEVLFIVQPTEMMSGWVAGRLTVPSRTASRKPTALGLDASPVPCT